MSNDKLFKQTVYCIPGLGASKAIFKYLPHHNTIRYHLLEQKLPKKGESFDAYIQRWAQEIKKEHSIVIGVSFGGIIAQELYKHRNFKKIILISSVTSPKAYPWFLKLTKYVPLHKLFLPLYIKRLHRIKSHPKSTKESKISTLINEFMPYIDLNYIIWSIDQILHWKPKTAPNSFVQIHGTKDEIFPYSKTKNAIPVKDGTHIMMICKRKWLENNLLCHLLN